MSVAEEKRLQRENSAQRTGTSSAGSRLPTRILALKATFSPTQKMSTEPTQDRSEMSDSLKKPATSAAARVMPPCKMPSGRAENMTPSPKVAANTITITKSSRDLENSRV